MCVFRVVNAGTQYLVLQRAKEETLYPGLWQIVTGTMKKGERALSAALRELKEETGCSPKQCWTIPYVDSYFDPVKEALQMVPVFAAELDASSTLHLSEEHQRCAWMRYDKARRRVVWPGQRRSMDIVNEFIIGNKETARLVQIPIERISL